MFTYVLRLRVVGLFPARRRSRGQHRRPDLDLDNLCVGTFRDYSSPHARLVPFLTKNFAVWAQKSLGICVGGIIIRGCFVDDRTK